MIDLIDFKSFLTIKAALADYTVKQYIIRIKVLFRYLENNNLELKKSSIESYLYSLKKRGISNRTINTYMASLKILDLYLKDRGNNLELVEGFKFLKYEKPVIIILSIEEIERLVITRLGTKHGNYDRIRDENLRICTEFIAYTGVRLSEALELKSRDVNILEKTVIIQKTKNNQYRKLYFTEPLLSDLEKLCLEKRLDDLVFTNSQGNHFHKGDFLLNLRERARRGGNTKRIHPHLLRHSFATHLYNATKDIGLVQMVLGHKDIESTMIYIHLADDAIQQGTYRHPLFRNHIPVTQITDYVMRDIDKYNLQNNPHIDYVKIMKAKEIIASAIK